MMLYLLQMMKFVLFMDEGNRSRMSRSSALALKMDLNLQFKRYDVAKEAAKN